MKSIFSPVLGSFLFVASASFAGQFPGPPGPSPSPNFTATLTGANAIPPNNSPLSTVGAIYGPFPFPVEPFGYTVYVSVDFNSSPLIGYDKILPESVSLQRQDGTPVTDGYYPLTLTKITGPLLPCFNTSNGWVCPPAFTLGWDGRFALTGEQVIELTTGQWYLNATFVSSNGISIPDYTIRGQILPVDADGDGVPDYQDECLGTESGAIVDNNGCSIEQLVPSAGPRSGGTWRNHGQYVSAVARMAEAFLGLGFLTQEQMHAVITAAARSNSGKK